jgi:hypothetical protein
VALVRRRAVPIYSLCKVLRHTISASIRETKIILLRERIRDLLQRLLPFERPRLSSIEMSGDQLNPTRVKPDLTKLTDEELDQLEKIVLKVGTGASGGPDGNAG